MKESKTGEPLVEVHRLRKTFGTYAAVADVNFCVYRGDLFGFLGPNGSGKSTTLRMLLGLVHPTSGSVRLLGQSMPRARLSALQKTGSLVESPDFYLYLSAWRNLEIVMRLYGQSPSRRRLNEVLDWVGLSNYAQNLVKTYSHGMKQRLAIAASLVHDPELIILDEPTSGLDPQGLHEVRHLLIHLQRHAGKTIVMSSHLLHEVEQMANRMAIIHKGHTVVEGTVNDLLTTDRLTVHLETNDNAMTRQHLLYSRWAPSLQASTEPGLLLTVSKKEVPEIVAFLHQQGMQLFQLKARRSLEDYFLRITQENNGSLT